MKKIFLIGFLLINFASAILAQTTSNVFADQDNTSSILNSAPFKELSLYSPQGDPVAYIDCNDGNTIYFWDGTAVAYLYQNDNLFSIYNFNGNHLGWFVNGIIIDHDGNMVGTSKNILSTTIYQLEPNKEFKKMKPVKKLKSPEPFTPLVTSFWSDMSLGAFLSPAPNK